jgi:hypothetical protein
MKRLGLLVFAAIALVVSLGSAGAADTKIQQFYAQTQAQLAAQDFDVLEAKSGEFRRDDKRFAGGVSRVLLFYRALSGQSLAANHWRDPFILSDRDASFEGQRELSITSSRGCIEIVGVERGRIFVVGDPLEPEISILNFRKTDPT